MNADHSAKTDGSQEYPDQPVLSYRRPIASLYDSVHIYVRCRTNSAGFFCMRAASRCSMTTASNNPMQRSLCAQFERGICLRAVIFQDYVLVVYWLHVFLIAG